MSIKNYSIDNTAFTIFVDNTLTDLDRKVLTHCYLPIIGDNLYNSCEVQKPASEKKIEFVASSIEFSNPLTNKRVVFEL